MSIFFKYLIVLFALFNAYCLQAQEVVYSPEFVDTFMIQNTQAEYVEGLSNQLSQNTINADGNWDVQHLKKQVSTPSIVLLLPIIILIIIIQKFLFTGFFKSTFSGIVNMNVFQLHYRNKKFSEQIPLILLFILRNIAVVLICQYLAYLYFDQSKYLNWNHFLVGFLVINIFYISVYLLEYFVFNMVGVGDMFRVYITQYFTITTWVWIPLVLLALLLYLNNIQLDINVILLLVVFPALLSAIFAIIRSILLWNGMWRDKLIYFFMYLCTFKIIPYLILTKIIEQFWL